jgi:hypothetical protein
MSQKGGFRTYSRSQGRTGVRKYRSFIVSSANGSYPTLCCPSPLVPVREESARNGRQQLSATSSCALPSPQSAFASIPSGTHTTMAVKKERLEVAGFRTDSHLSFKRRLDPLLKGRLRVSNTSRLWDSGTFWLVCQRIHTDECCRRREAITSGAAK